MMMPNLFNRHAGTPGERKQTRTELDHTADRHSGGPVASLVTLAFRGIIDLINHLLFHSDSEITVAMHVWPWIFWPLLVGGRAAGRLVPARGGD